MSECVGSMGKRGPGIMPGRGAVRVRAPRPMGGCGCTLSGYIRRAVGPMGVRGFMPRSRRKAVGSEETYRAEHAETRPEGIRQNSIMPIRGAMRSPLAFPTANSVSLPIVRTGCG